MVYRNNNSTHERVSSHSFNNHFTDLLSFLWQKNSCLLCSANGIALLISRGFFFIQKNLYNVKSSNELYFEWHETRVKECVRGHKAVSIFALLSCGNSKKHCKQYISEHWITVGDVNLLQRQQPRIFGIFFTTILNIKPKKIIKHKWLVCKWILF